MDSYAIFRERISADLVRFRKFLRQVVRNRLAFAGLIIIMFFIILSVAAPLLVGPYPTQFERTTPEQPPSPQHALGTDAQGYDTLTLLLYGGQVSLVIAFTASAVAMIVGTLVGLVAGYYGRLTDQVLARATDFFLVIPWLPFALILMTILSQTMATMIIAIALVSWPTTARVIRSQVITIKQRMFITRSRAIGAASPHIIRKHILPNVMPLVWAEAVLTISGAVFTEAFLSFFGLGPKDNPIFSWGTMVNQSYQDLGLLSGRWWYFGPPGIFITLVVLGFAMLGYGLEEILNPALRRR
jgi:peptide/nickel transport system permease protein